MENRSHFRSLEELIRALDMERKLLHANSYIVYEVEHEHGPFSIITFRSSVSS